MRTKTEINSSMWFGELPENWSMVPLSALFRFSKGLSITKADLVETGKPVISYGQIHSKHNTGVEIREILLRRIPNDLVGDTSPSRVLSDGFVFADTSEDLEGCGNNVRNDIACELYGGYHTVVLNPKRDFNSKYLAYLFATDAWRFQIRRDLVDVKLFSVSQTCLNETYAIVPPYDAQQRIVSYLDERCSAIDKDVAKRRQIIEKLKEFKRSFIAHTVTKGLDSNVEMKDSGVEWIGEVPADWQAIKVKYIASYRNGLTYSPSDLADSGTRVLRSCNIVDGKIDYEDSVFVHAQVPNGLMAKTGDILICSRNGSRRLIGKNALITRDGDSFGAFMMIARPVCDSQYFYYLLNSNIFDYYLPSFLTSTVNQLTGSNFGQMQIPFTSDLGEQKNIASYLDERCAKIDEAISRQEQLIEKLGEYRKSIIHHAVTGKTDCTEAAK